ncbi:sensor histidine kinase [Frondihabitans sp. PhB188]|uniref:sensor histidine kinase n=1 Tax=Frondihabitans sp. PhB188 TaxID=2485200 RepID=UPI0011CD7A22|nr:ATP-binding protein [Frondihabitans sp. PhB188]
MSKAITSTLVEQAIARVYAGIALVFGATAVGPAFSGQRVMDQRWAWVFGLLLFSGLTASAMAGVLVRWVRPASGVVAVAYFLMVVSWPFAVSDITHVQPQPPWLWGLCNVAMAAAVVGFSELLAGAYVFAVSVAWCLIRLTPSGGAVGIERALQDAGYVFILGMAVLLVALMLRRTALEVDQRHIVATTRYATATKEHEFEKQRMTVDALLHDSVLTTLLQVSRADTPAQQRLAARMAITSLNVIADTEESFDQQHAPVTAGEVTTRFQQIRAELGVPVTLRITGPDAHDIPHAVAETLFAAALQALVNSVQHAGPAVTVRSVTVDWTGTCVTVTIRDDGQGFDTAAPSPRLGVRVSIIERMDAIGGTTVIDSAPGQGTRVALTWVHPVAALHVADGGGVSPATTMSPKAKSRTPAHVGQPSRGYFH